MTSPYSLELELTFDIVDNEDSFSNKEEYMLDKTYDNMANPLDLH